MGLALGAAVVGIALVLILSPRGGDKRPPAPPGALATGRPTIMQDDALVLYRGDEVIRAVRRISELGADWLLVNAAWSNIAPAAESSRRPAFDATDPAAYPPENWGPLDHAVTLARQHGLQVMVDIGFWAPRWAVTRRVAPMHAQRWDIDPREFGAFAQAVARRYSGRYRGLPGAVAFQIWNEPNNGDFLLPQWRRSGGQWSVDSARVYRRMLYAAYPAIKREAPASLVLVGGTFQSGFDRPKSEASAVSPLLFLRELVCVSPQLLPRRGGDCRSFRRLPGDGWAHHPYSPRSPPGRSDPIADHVGVADLSRLTSLLRRLHGAGRLARPMAVWVTEFGYETNPPDPTQVVDPQAQARYLPEAEYLAYRDPLVRSFAQFLLRDGAERPERAPGRRWSDFQSGLERVDGTPKPALNAFRYGLVVRRAGSDKLAWWGHVRPGAGPQTVRIARRGAGGAWLPAPHVGTPFQTDAGGYFSRAARADPEATYRLEVDAGGRWEAGEPVTAGRNPSSVQ